MILFVTVFLAAALQQLVYLPINRGYLELAGIDALLMPILLMLARPPRGDNRVVRRRAHAEVAAT